MLPVPVSFLDKNVYAYQQICKRAQNTLDSLISKRYIISEKKWFRTLHYEVNVFGEFKHKFGNLDNILEYLLETDHISSPDYQLLKYYDNKYIYDHIIEDLYSRKNDDVILLSTDEVVFLYELATFAENPSITKEEILSGEQLRQT